MGKTIKEIDLGKGPSVMTAEEFAKLSGEKFQGLRILKLEPNTGAGPFTLTKILKEQDLNSAGPGKRKKLAPVDVYVANDEAGLEIRMPVAASFIGKAEDAALAVGDTFSVFRTEDYKSKAYGTTGKGFNIVVHTRAKKKA